MHEEQLLEGDGGDFRQLILGKEEGGTLDRKVGITTHRAIKRNSSFCSSNSVSSSEIPNYKGSTL